MFEENLKTGDGIELPDNFRKVILKLHPEIENVVIVDYEIMKKYNPYDFSPISYFMVNLSVYFNQDDIPKGHKEFYAESFSNLFTMTYGGEMDFISFKVCSLIVPSEKTNDDKFYELFRKKVDAKNHL
jgi:uncharacterized protein YkvS